MTITDQQITAIAREYAEDATKAMAGDPNLSASDLNGIKRDVAEYAEEVIRFILRTHCIVSKEKVNEAYQKALNQIAGGRGYDIPRIESYGTGKQKVLESLFDAETFKNSEV